MLQGQINRQFGAWQPREQLKWKRTFDANFWVFPLIRVGLYFCCTLGEVAVCREGKSSWQSDSQHVFPDPQNATWALRSSTSLCLSSRFFWTVEEKQLGDKVTDLVSLTEHFYSFHGMPVTDLDFIYPFSFKPSQWLVPRSSALRVLHSTF